MLIILIIHGTRPKIADHDGVLASYKLNLQKPTTKSKKIYNYNDVDIIGLTNYIKNYDYDNVVFSQPILRQAEIFNEILSNAFSQFVPYMAKHWNKLDVGTQVMMLPDFKTQLKKDFKPCKYKHFSKGSKIGNSLFSKIRLNRSDLNQHKFDIGQHDTPECLCHAKSESSLHYIMDCFLYSGERQTLFNLVEHYIPNFTKLSKTKQFEILLLGISPENPEFHTTNTILSIAVQKFILKSKRFHETYT